MDIIESHLLWYLCTPATIYYNYLNKVRQVSAHISNHVHSTVSKYKMTVLQKTLIQMVTNHEM